MGRRFNIVYIQKVIQSAVVPVAGLGTRLLPATKSQPKEMLPLVDKPIIQYGVEEALTAGVDNIIIPSIDGDPEGNMTRFATEVFPALLGATEH